MKESYNLKLPGETLNGKGEAYAPQEENPSESEKKDTECITREVIQILNLSSPIWFSRGKLIRCLKHNAPLGHKHLCDEILQDINVPSSLAEILGMRKDQ